MIATIDTVAEVIDVVRSGSPVVPVGGRTKPALWQSPDPDVVTLDLGGLRGITEYDPAELTFTAHAGTPLAQVSQALAEHGQHLPFDPPLAARGATLAGAVAAATSGPGAFAHGGVRDFVIGVQLVDGTGRLVSGGGKVVKNAAGFDLPKLMVGSMGRLGVIVRLCFKVFPAPRATTTLVFDYGDSAGDALSAMGRVARGPLQAQALELTPGGRLLVRLGGHPDALDARAARCAVHLGGAAPERVDGDQEQAQWERLAGFGWQPPGTDLVRVALTVAHAPALLRTLTGDGATVHLSLGANLAWVAWPVTEPLALLDRRLTELGLRAMRLTTGADGTSAAAGPALLGGLSGGAFGQRVRAALDPDLRFLDF